MASAEPRVEAEPVASAEPRVEAESVASAGPRVEAESEEAWASSSGKAESSATSARKTGR